MQTHDLTKHQNKTDISPNSNLIKKGNSAPLTHIWQLWRGRQGKGGVGRGRMYINKLTYAETQTQKT